MFEFKKFKVDDTRCGMKICTDSVLLGAWVALAGSQWSRVLDLGAGSGLLTLMVAQRFPQAQITALEIDEGACADAQANFQASPWSSRLSVVCANAWDYQPAESLDLIICNPPYFGSTLISPDQARARARHGATAASGLQGQVLNAAAAIELASRWLAPDGALAMVTPADGWQQLVFEAELKRLRLRRQCCVSAVEQRPANRMLWLFSPQDGTLQREDLAIRDPQGNFTLKYRQLTQDFYLKF